MDAKAFVEFLFYTAIVVGIMLAVLSVLFYMEVTREKTYSDAEIFMYIVAALSASAIALAALNFLLDK